MGRVARTTSVVYVVAALYLTLWTPPWSPGLVDDEAGAAWFKLSPAPDVVVNVAMFLPLGAFVCNGWPRIRAGRAIVAAAAVSFAIEVLQATVFTHRWAQLSDVVLNVTGFALGHLWARWIAAATRESSA